MSLLDRLRSPQATAEVVPDPATLPIASPWSAGELSPVVAHDIFGAAPANTRGAAMRLPAIARARNLLVATGCRIPLRAYVGETQRPDTDTPFLYRTGTVTTWQHRNAWTIDDLIFHGWSLWYKTAVDAAGFPLAADRIDRASWAINGDNRVEIDGTVVADNQVILIPGLHEGILRYGLEAIADARELYRIVRDRIENPIPAIDLHQTEGETLSKTERDELVASWKAARKAKGGAAVGYTSKAIEARELGAKAGNDLLIEARNAAALDLARVVGVAASRIDATAPKSSLNYETTAGRNQELVDFDLALYLTPIAARLSLDDCVPRGTRVAHDFTDFTAIDPSRTGPTMED